MEVYGRSCVKSFRSLGVDVRRFEQSFLGRDSYSIGSIILIGNVDRRNAEMAGKIAAGSPKSLESDARPCRMAAHKLTGRHRPFSRGLNHF